MLGAVNDGFAFQAFIWGFEYVADMVATDKGFLVASVCRCHKVEMNGSKFVYDSVDLSRPTGCGAEQFE